MPPWIGIAALVLVPAIFVLAVALRLARKVGLLP